MLKLFFDGGCRPNPGPIEIAVVAIGVTYRRDDLGIGTNNDAEWLAAIEALAVARRLGATDVRLFGDSAVVVAQANGLASCRTPALRAHRDAFTRLRQDFMRVRIRRIGRHQNLAGIALDRARSGR